MTLKLADEDAAVVGSILRAVSMQPSATDVGEGNQGYKNWFQSIRASHSNRQLSRILELAGAFQTAVRANER